jgi:surface antigen
VPPFDLNLGHCNRAALGAALGGATGGAIGSQIGKGDGRTAAIIGGTVLGILIGGSIGQQMDRVDQNCVGQILEHAPDREVITWNTAETGTRHEVTPVKTYEDTRGRYCREYQAVSVIGGEKRQTYGTACRQADGSWQLIN